MSAQASKPPTVGRNIQHIRKQQQLTLGVLAERSGVSKAMLSQIELEKVNPTVATVWKIARGLDVELDSLVKGSESEVRKFAITGSGQLTSLGTSAGGLDLKVMSPMSMAEDLEIYLLTFESGVVLRSSSHAAGTEEYLTVLDGEIKVIVGDRTAELKAGDFIMYSCDIDHCISNPATEKARVHMIVRFASRKWELSRGSG